ncbi:TIR domain-containing protein [Marinicrinis sediminis]|uniref:TIR domain-containing protein n=1 Tax=Marinicrinis sediminis TaxID=1652465 RepID=A0ABW5R872_9BACL
MKLPKPRLFIGSARESIQIAAAVHEALVHFAEVSPWYAGTFQPMNDTMDDLEERLNASDFAVFIFSPDDIVLHRGRLVVAPRDNTVFEMGLFWGRLRRGRVFFLVPDAAERTWNDETVTDFHLLSDMQGLTTLSYEHRRSDHNVNAAVSVACMKIGAIIQEKGAFPDPLEAWKKAQAEMERDESLHHFFLHFVKDLMRDPKRKYEYLYDAMRGAYRAIEGYRVAGAAVWRAKGSEGLEQVAGNVGRNQFYPFSVNDHPDDSQPRIHIMDAYQKSLERLVLLNNGIVKTYLICYPVGKDILVVIHLTGKHEMSRDHIEAQLEENHKLISTIHYLFGGDVI